MNRESLHMAADAGMGAALPITVPEPGDVQVRPLDFTQKRTQKQVLEARLLDPNVGLAALIRDAEQLPLFTKPLPPAKSADEGIELTRLDAVLGHVRQWQHSAFPFMSWEAYLKSVSALRGTQRDWMYRVEEATLPAVVDEGNNLDGPSGPTADEELWEGADF